MSMKDLTFMVMPDRRVWIDADSLVEYLRMVQRQASGHADYAKGLGDTHMYAAAAGADGMLQQIADSIQVTVLSAVDRLESQRVPE